MHPLESQLAVSWPPALWSDVTVVAAVSGGADSVALLRALAALRRAGPGRLVVGHFNHRLRGEQSDDDEAFVQSLAAELALPCRVHRAARAAEHAAEATTRAERQQFFRQLAGQLGARFVATAHTAEDQAETILHRIVRGTGIGGLAGIPRTRPLLPGVALIRPMLEIRRDQVRAYLQSLGQPFREDASNRDRRFTRNRLRHELLPHLAEHYNANVIEALQRLGRLAGEVQGLVDRTLADAVERCVIETTDRAVTIGCHDLPADDFTTRELLIRLWKQQAWPLQAMSYEKWEQLAALSRQRLAAAETRTIDFPGSIRATKTGDSLTLSRP